MKKATWKVLRTWTYTAATEASVLEAAKEYSRARREDGEGVPLRLAKFAATRMISLLELVES